jgi:hypothetical protein
MKKAIHIFLLLMLIFSILNCTTQKQKDEEIRTAIFESNYPKARALVRDYYENDRQKTLGWILVIQKLEMDCWEN